MKQRILCATHIINENDKVDLPQNCIALRTDATPQKSLSYMLESEIWNIVQKDRPQFEDRLALASSLIQEPETFLDNPTQKIFSKKSAVERRWEFRASSQKRSIIDSIYQYIPTIPGAKGIADFVTMVADELFTNAIFNGPFGDSEVALHRDMIVVLDREKSAQLIVSYDEGSLFLGCLDSFGTLECGELLSRTRRGFDIGASKHMNMDIGGAGIGVMRVIELSSDIYIVVEKGKRALVGSSFLLKKGPNLSRTVPKNFLFQSFQNIQTPSSQVRIERREKKILLRILGDLSPTTSIQGLDLGEPEEIIFDLTQVSQFLENGLENLMAQSQKFSTKSSYYLRGQCDKCGKDESVFCDFAQMGKSVRLNGLICPECGESLRTATAT